MPELPEVETIKLGLQRKIVGLKIKKIKVLTPKSFIGDPKFVQGKTVLNIWRKAKMLGIDLRSDIRGPADRHSGGRRPIESKQKDATSAEQKQALLIASLQHDSVMLLFHLKMTGQLIYDDGKRFIGGHPTPDMVGELPNKSTRVIFTFSGGSKLFFNDQRRFGWVRVIDSRFRGNDSGVSGNDSGVSGNDSVILNLIEDLGPEPLEKGFTWESLKMNLLRHKSMPVKVALLDQRVVSGLGNIYANEACFAAGINPATKVVALTDKQFRALHSGVVRVLREGIKYGGSSRAHFVDAEGRRGYFLDYAKIYWLDKKPCKVCGEIIKKIQLGGRGTYYCPKCQK